MRNIAIIDETFDSNVNSTYHLSIQFSEKYCSYAILEPDGMKYLVFKSYWFEQPITANHQADQIRLLLLNDENLRGAFKAVFFMYTIPVSVLVPTPLFRREKPETYFKYSSVLNDTDKIFFRKIADIDAFTVSPVPLTLVNQVRLIWPGVQFFHQSTPQIVEAISGSMGKYGANRVLANIDYGFVDITVVKSEKLILYNSFKIRNTDDLVFFICYMFDQFTLSQQDSQVILSGFTDLYPGLLELLGQYIKKVLINDISGKFSFPAAVDKLEYHHYSQLLNLARCEL